MDSEIARVDRERLQLPAHPEHRQRYDSPSQKNAMPRWRAKGREKSSVTLACSWIVEHQISISFTLLGALFSTHILFANARHHTRKFFRISYYNPATDKFALGWDDIFFVFYWIVVFTGLRCLCMEYILAPFASVCGIHKKKAKVRFAEQAWILLYPAMFWTTGMYIMYHSDFWLDLHALWKDWPIREMDGLWKWYYLVQFAFWLQQIVVVNIEERRKDYVQMFSHHVVTCVLIFASYGYHMTKVGTLIMCLMDIVDILLPAAKLLKYMKYQTACDVGFGLFMVTWFATRHVLFPWVLWSIYSHLPAEIEYGCYSGNTQNLQGPMPIPNGLEVWTMPFRDPVGMVCFNDGARNLFLAMLIALQGILCMWFVMIVRVAYKVITGQGAEDSRSDDEDEDEEEQIEEQQREKTTEKKHFGPDTKVVAEKQALPSEYPSRPSSAVAGRRKEGGHSSGINVLSSSDRKELLGRIGCDKPT